jgi:FtsP/CotA-like multicopper oxidase with cupredoxin domain
MNCCRLSSSFFCPLKSHLTPLVYFFLLRRLQYDPAYGFWGLQFQNIHFHGAQFPPSIENLRSAIDGGESKEYEFQIPEDMAPGLFWYHNHFHGTSAYSYLSSLFGVMVVEGTDSDITKAPGIEDATEIFVVISEGWTDADKNVPPFFPIVFRFDWKSLANGVFGEQTEYQVMQGEKILFRTVSASIEPTIRLSIPDVSFVIVAYDGLPLPKPEEVEVVTVTGGSRVEFLARFDTPGTYIMTRAAWNVGIDTAEKCLAAFGAEVYPCVSYDVEQVAFTITVLADDSFVAATASLISEVELPAYSEKLMALAATDPVAEKLVTFEQALTYPIFQVPYDGVFVPPGVGFGMNGRLMTPWHYAGNVTAGTCETWTVTSFPPGVEHPFHAHAAKFMVTHINAVEVETPFWRDTFPVDGSSFTAHICFNDNLKPCDAVIAHCHMPNHLDIGLGSLYKVVAGAEAETPTSAPTPSAETPTSAPTPSAAVSPAVFLFSAIAVVISVMVL